MSKNKQSEDSRSRGSRDGVVKTPASSGSRVKDSSNTSSTELDELLSGSGDVYYVTESYGSEPIKINKKSK